MRAKSDKNDGLEIKIDQNTKIGKIGKIDQSVSVKIDLITEIDQIDIIIDQIHRNNTTDFNEKTIQRNR